MIGGIMLLILLSCTTANKYIAEIEYQKVLDVMCYEDWMTLDQIWAAVETSAGEMILKDRVQMILTELVYDGRVAINTPDPRSDLKETYRRRHDGGNRPCDVIPVGIPSTQPA
ncbi:MAG: hypothetical protein KBD47_00630 [Candidatus Pacebacteria bacterium]|nr:hypothetical protein [Candidatus Paceibacterota bacterium]